MKMLKGMQVAQSIWTGPTQSQKLNGRGIPEFRPSFSDFSTLIAVLYRMNLNIYSVGPFVTGFKSLELAWFWEKENGQSEKG